VTRKDRLETQAYAAAGAEKQALLDRWSRPSGLLDDEVIERPRPWCQLKPRGYHIRYEIIDYRVA
jgi:hypothetical protein